MARLRLVMCQVDTVVGDVVGNADRVIERLRICEESGADLAAFPELTVTGYPPEDLLLKPAFVSDNLAAIRRVARATGSCCAVVGFVDVVGSSVKAAAADPADSAGTGDRRLHNALALCREGSVVGVYHKRHLPNYGVFDEERWFAPGTGSLRLYRIAGIDVGLSICEDLWFPGGPVAAQGRAGAGLVVNCNASPYSIGRVSQRLETIRERVSESGSAIAYVNQVGGQDELVFDGASMVVDRDGRVVAAGLTYSEDMVMVDVDLEAAAAGGSPADSSVGEPSEGSIDVAVLSVSSRQLAVGPGELPGAAPRRSLVCSLSPPSGFPPSGPWALEEEVYGALVLGTRDYLAKNDFKGAVIGLSGGIDSSLVATVAVDAIGPGTVHGLAMPSRYSSEGSIVDARALADSLGIGLAVVPIEPAHGAFAALLGPLLGSVPVGLTDENLQSRIRGVLLMAVSNQQGWIVLTTGNKSELATGYSTLYGDSAGGFAVIKDVPKTLVYRLCAYRNALGGRDVIPRSVLEKPPSAELRPGQRDDQSLPSYELLDPVLQALVEEDLSVAQVVGRGFPPDVVTRVARLVDLAEYKRRQSPPGVRITTKAFGKDRRVPITNRYRDDRTESDAPTPLEHPMTPEHLAPLEHPSVEL